MATSASEIEMSPCRLFKRMFGVGDKFQKVKKGHSQDVSSLRKVLAECQDALDLTIDDITKPHKEGQK